MDTSEIIKMEKENYLGVFIRPEFVLSHGDGMYLYDTEGKQYLDFTAGIAVNALGYNDKGALKTLTDQAAKLWHCSNLYYTEPQVRAAALLTRHTFADKVFFCNSGTEAIEGAIKLARKWAHVVKGVKKPEIICFFESFHGRTYGALSATGQPKFWQNIEPVLEGFCFAEFNRLNSVNKVLNNNTCAIMVEPVQGESGIFPADPEFLTGLKQIAESNNLLLIADEVQCGMGRTGTFCAVEQYNIKPDIMALAKPLAGGLPIGAILATDAVAKNMAPGDHGSTFGGGPIVCAVAEYTIRRVVQPEFLQKVKENGQYLLKKLKVLTGSYGIKTIRGIGLMVGAEMEGDAGAVIKACAENGLLVVKAGHNTVRFLPPLIVGKDHIDQALDIFIHVLKG
ncbi:aspartate aminotransferase family protein [candidate division KSB1 bacterium]|nr:aspartate aminotransferase family protein [candidate division KSB1 bacterium]